VTDLPAEIDLYADDDVGFARKLRAGDDFVHWRWARIQRTRRRDGDELRATAHALAEAGVSIMTNGPARPRCLQCSRFARLAC
jgi:hypothetical protein